MVEVKLNHSNENPFYGMRNCLQLFNNLNGTITTSMLDAGYEEVKNDKAKRELFYSLLFAVGDITNRQHNIFKSFYKRDLDNGGNANRESFWTIFLWMKEKHYKQFVEFLTSGLFNEYTCFDFLFRSRVQTKGKRVVRVYDIFSDVKYCDDLANYLYRIINGNNPFTKHLVAKFLTIPRLSKRQNHKKMLEETKNIMLHKSVFLIKLSKLMGWEYVANDNYADFKGYRKWRQAYNQELESVLFSSKQILTYDKEQFLEWFDKLPAQARFRVKNRILYSKIETATHSFPSGNSTHTETPKYPQMIEWYKEWEKNKEAKQAEQRALEEKVRQGQASEEDKIKLEKVKKEAKVNIGATNFNELYNDICNGTIDKLKLESFMNKVNLPYNSLVIIDDSGSMRGAPFNFASFIASVCLVKNPDDDGRNLLGFFNGRSHWHGFINSTIKDSPNSIMRTQVAQVVKSPFVNPKLSFYGNYKCISNFCQSVFQGGCTNISAIPEGLKQVCDKAPAVLDALKAYPVWTIISDGEWNNLRSPEASINDFFRKCENYFGFRPYIVAIDIINPRYSSMYYGDLSRGSEKFSGIDNLMYIPSNPAMIEQFLTNFKDMDVFDVYTPLQSIYRSNRYELVRTNTL